MKKTTLTLFAAILTLLLSSPVLQAEEDTVNMTSGYALDVYYNIVTGVETTSPRELWDIAFSTKVFSASILINDGSGTELYTWGNGDTSGWAMVDTIGLSTWKPLYNDENDWEMGAFTRNENGHPDYGWGMYNSITHEVIGDSLYILKKADGMTYKIWIKKKTYNMGNPVYIFKKAMLDGSNESEVTIDCTPYTTKNFIYYSLTAGQVIDREPASADWDILFTKYVGLFPGNNIPVVVTGVLSNYNLGVSEVHGVSQLLFTDPYTQPYDSARGVIGWDWKTFNMATFTYVVDDSVVYFMQAPDGDIWKLYFEVFQGTSTGIITLRKFNITTSGLEDIEAGDQAMLLYPNPASDRVNLSTDLEAGQQATVQVCSMNGAIVREHRFTGQAGLETESIPLEGLPGGVYFVRLQSGSTSATSKLIIR